MAIEQLRTRLSERKTPKKIPSFEPFHGEYVIAKQYRHIPEKATGGASLLTFLPVIRKHINENNYPGKMIPGSGFQRIGNIVSARNLTLTPKRNASEIQFAIPPELKAHPTIATQTKALPQAIRQLEETIKTHQANLRELQMVGTASARGKELQRAIVTSRKQANRSADQVEATYHRILSTMNRHYKNQAKRS